MFLRGLRATCCVRGCRVPRIFSTATIQKAWLSSQNTTHQHRLEEATDCLRQGTEHRRFQSQKKNQYSYSLAYPSILDPQTTEMLLPYFSGSFSLDNREGTVLHRAVNKGDLPMLRKSLADLHSHVNKVSKTIVKPVGISTAMFSALTAPSSPAEPSLAYRYMVCVRDIGGMDALTQSVAEDNLTMVETLLDAGADLNAVFDTVMEGVVFTPAILAYDMGLMHMIDFFLERGLDPAVIVGDKSLLYNAVLKNDDKFVKKLLKRGVDPHDMERALGFPIIQAAILTSTVPVVRLLLDCMCAQIDPSYKAEPFFPMPRSSAESNDKIIHRHPSVPKELDDVVDFPELLELLNERKDPETMMPVLAHYADLFTMFLHSVETIAHDTPQQALSVDDLFKQITGAEPATLPQSTNNGNK